MTGDRPRSMAGGVPALPAPSRWRAAVRGPRAVPAAARWRASRRGRGDLSARAETSSTCARWCTTPSCWSCRSPRCAGTTAPGFAPTCGADLNAAPCGCTVSPLTPGGRLSTHCGDQLRRRAAMRRLAAAPRIHRPPHRGPELEASLAGAPPSTEWHPLPTTEQDLLPWPSRRRRHPRPRAAAAGPAHWTLSAPARSVCPQCHNAKLPHVVCPTCGWYKGRQAIDVG